MALLLRKEDCYLREFHSFTVHHKKANLQPLRTTNHLERLDPALSRPGRMDVWVEFKNASRWQAEALFRNFFPSEEDDDIEGQDLDSVHLEPNIEVQELIRADEQHESKPRVYKPVDPLSMLKNDENGSIPPNTSLSSSSSSSLAPSSTLWSLATSASSLLNGVASSSSSPPPPLPKTYSGPPIDSSSPSQSRSSPSPTSKLDKSQFGATNTAYLPPPPDASITAKSMTKPLDMKTLAVLAKKFADGIPEEEFSVAGLQGCQFFLVFLFLVNGT